MKILFCLVLNVFSITSFANHPAEPLSVGDEVIIKEGWNAAETRVVTKIVSNQIIWLTNGVHYRRGELVKMGLPVTSVSVYGTEFQVGDTVLKRSERPYVSYSGFVIAEMNANGYTRQDGGYWININRLAISIESLGRYKVGDRVHFTHPIYDRISQGAEAKKTGEIMKITSHHNYQIMADGGGFYWVSGPDGGRVLDLASP